MREKQKGPPVLEHRRANQGDGLTTHHQKFNTELEDLQMKKKITGNVLSAGAIVLGLTAAGCGGAIENAANGWAMLGYTLLPGWAWWQSSGRSRRRSTRCRRTR